MIGMPDCLTPHVCAQTKPNQTLSSELRFDYMWDKGSPSLPGCQSGSRFSGQTHYQYARAPKVFGHRSNPAHGRAFRVPSCFAAAPLLAPASQAGRPLTQQLPPCSILQTGVISIKEQKQTAPGRGWGGAQSSTKAGKWALCWERS